MGNWGTDILDGDHEMDLFEGYRERRAAGDDPATAVAVVMAGDRDEPVACVALAAAVLALGDVEPDVFTRALAAIEARQEAGLTWRGSATSERAELERRVALDRFASTLRIALRGGPVSRELLPTPLGGHPDPADPFAEP